MGCNPEKQRRFDAGRRRSQRVSDAVFDGPAEETGSDAVAMVALARAREEAARRSWAGIQRLQKVLLQ